MLKPWKINSKKNIVKDEWCHVEAHDCQTDSGVKISPYYVYKPKDWVVIIAFDCSGDVVIERQYRHGIEKFCYEFPAGNIEPGEDPLECAQRELMEETGHRKGEWEFLGKFAVNSANHSNYMHAYVAKNLERGVAVQADIQEELECMSWSVGELYSKIDDMEFQNPHHLAVWYKYLRLIGA